MHSRLFYLIYLVVSDWLLHLFSLLPFFGELDCQNTSFTRFRVTHMRASRRLSVGSVVRKNSTVKERIAQHIYDRVRDGRWPRSRRGGYPRSMGGGAGETLEHAAVSTATSGFVWRRRQRPANTAGGPRTESQSLASRSQARKPRDCSSARPKRGRRVITSTVFDRHSWSISARCFAAILKITCTPSKHDSRITRVFSSFFYFFYFTKRVSSWRTSVCPSDPFFYSFIWTVLSEMSDMIWLDYIAYNSVITQKHSCIHEGVWASNPYNFYYGSRVVQIVWL